jgi:hypothetical protein
MKPNFRIHIVPFCLGVLAFAAASGGNRSPRKCRSPNSVCLRNEADGISTDHPVGIPCACRKEQVCLTNSEKHRRISSVCESHNTAKITSTPANTNTSPDAQTMSKPSRRQAPSHHFREFSLARVDWEDAENVVDEHRHEFRMMSCADRCLSGVPPAEDTQTTPESMARLSDQGHAKVSGKKRIYVVFLCLVCGLRCCMFLLHPHGSD